MSSTYAPLPFSYLAPGGAKPRVGLRKDGVYGTSADVPRIYENPESIRPSELGYTENPYNIYINAGDTSGQNQRPSNEGPFKPIQPFGRLPPVQDSVYETQDGFSDRSKKPEVVIPRRPTPEPDYVRMDPDVGLQAPKKSEYVRREQNRPISQERVATYYPPQLSSGRDTYEILEEPKPQSSKPPDAMAGYDNFILVKDPNIKDSKPASNISSSRSDPPKTKLESFFETKDQPNHQQQRINGKVPPPTNQADYGDRKTKPRDATGFDGPNYPQYNGMEQFSTERATVNEERSKDVHGSNGYGQQSAYKNKEQRTKDTCCCACNTCTAVVVAIIITAIICLGAGFVAGWFGGIAARENNSGTTVPLSQSDTNQSSVAITITTTTSASSLTTSKTTTAQQQPSTTTRTTTTTSTTTTSATTTKPSSLARSNSIATR